ncbi:MULTISPECIES: hypothetical protein [unclassified Paenibacillus]|uniref:hypothetical protein n=1 Tax=unclassified Paenibacillus TaxID=185978 RepID=UPI001042AABD|nr:MULTISPECIES: hypothetical protein [unclassified Paenibacillus]NIK71930.1 hypothetical protein [Paenibacillus sp. BK720]TCM96576.1 hypothetical protein EV294_105443 [Paenibacillus sp. BK033]
MEQHYYNNAHIFWDEVIESVVIRWNSFATGDDFREPLDRLIELAVIKKAKKALFDNSHILVMKDDMKWLSEEWLPRLKNAGIQYTATVNPTNSVRNNGLNEEVAEESSTKLQHHEFEGVQKAIAWLSEIAA